MNEQQILNEREKGQIPISIATSLAIESFVGIHPEIEHASMPAQANHTLLINLRTLVRNIYGSLNSEKKKRLTLNGIVDFVKEEMMIIEDIVAQYSNNYCFVRYYFFHYSGLPRRFPFAELRSPSTELQIHYAILENNILKKIKESEGSYAIVEGDTSFKERFNETAIMTHYPVDLLDRGNFKSIVLLESHTGAIKSHLEFQSKLTNGKQLSRIPFNALTLQVFGDNNNHFIQQPKVVRDSVIESATKYKWTPLTTQDKIHYAIRETPDPAVRVTLMQLAGLHR